MRAEERDFGWSKVKVSGLYLLWFDVKSVEGRKEVKSQSVRTKCSLEELYEWEQAKRKEKNNWKRAEEN